jgi:hypothetical protein
MSKVQEIINLAQYIYLDSSTLDLETNIDRLRKLISLYIAANVKIILKHTLFIELIKGRGAFMRDLWKCVVPKKPIRDITRLDS